ncbi:putative DNA-binding transcriptional regulator YafY [Stackebrandtia albiflava]|uniref:Putative DNA-binding transcriptional regulator YafY n=1 Tax=Stackebrandtia albiflava TaxID=406432 RepID=A0A562URJ5_9ACTN|nr:transcriptional regulator [Stackebrandtia albiflava]TWJ08239.1 putative DNA-binding transcriptional regulator YafY [Stackebrandtia albiflava]
MRAARLINLVLLLQRRGTVTAERLARELGVTTRTITRDVLELAEAGIGVETIRGRSGGYRLSEDLRLRLGGLEAAEVEALFLSGVPEAVTGLGLADASAAARLKVAAALSPRARSAPDRVRERFHLDAPGWFREAPPPPHLGDLARAVWQNRHVTVTYQAGTRVWSTEPPPPTRGRLAPYGLVLKAGVWYLIAARDGDLRSYRVDRVQAVEVTEERFTRDPDFDLAAHWRAQSDRFGVAILRERITVRLSPAGVDLIGHAVSPHAYALIKDHLAPRPATVEIPVETLDVAYTEMLRLGPEVEVVAPASLRERMAEAARRTAALYR